MIAYFDGSANQLVSSVIDSTCWPKITWNDPTKHLYKYRTNELKHEAMQRIKTCFETI